MSRDSNSVNGDRPLDGHGPFPGGKRFAFTIIDDTDVATVENLKPIYDLLYECGMRTTKTVWPVRCLEGSKVFGSSQTLEDDDYRAFILDLQRRGFEITWHGATMHPVPASEQPPLSSAFAKRSAITAAFT